MDFFLSHLMQEFSNWMCFMFFLLHVFLTKLYRLIGGGRWIGMPDKDRWVGFSLCTVMIMCTGPITM